MPELPEVETIVRALRRPLCGQTITELWSDWPRGLSPALPAARQLLVGRTITAVARRGKFVVIRVGEPAAEPMLAAGRSHTGTAILIHLRMSGRLTVCLRSTPLSPHVHFRITLRQGYELRFDDARKFGRVVVTPHPLDILNGLGVEPLGCGFTPGWLTEALRARSRQVKPLLLDQTFIAGLGNIYTDEALHRAGIHPQARCNGLGTAKVARLHRAVRTVLRLGIRRNGASIDWVYPGGGMQKTFRVYGRSGEPCKKCGRSIVKKIVGSRGTHFCPGCQPPA